MFINPLSGNSSQKPEEKKVKNKKSSKSHKSIHRKKNSFTEIMDLNEIEIIKKDLNKLLEKIEEYGAEFKRSPIERNLEKYKKSVKSFLKKIEKNLYKLNSKMNFKEKNFYIVAEKINNELKSLTDDLLKNEAGAFIYAKKIDSINGLLLDLYK
ncbi:YaaR family protein [Marinitoga aeolica]|uniref:YaaR family protein n=1 Tax=Marinitoga aeolica TaxID=2809031 RepID=A0ABY8PNV2_9BACT|nr:YaaR family protein [Marinitoga aeolica]WGS64269.1 YaaR family protein [Marinitoga aeolica]